MSAIRSPSCTENFHIFFEGLRKHFLYVCRQANFQPFSNANLETFSQTNNTLRDIATRKNNSAPEKIECAIYNRYYAITFSTACAACRMQEVLQ